MTQEEPHPQPVPGLVAADMPTLCTLAAQGDQDAVTQLLFLHHSRLLGFTIRKIGVDWQGKLDPEDVLQEAYIGVFAGIATFEYRGEDSFYYWVTRIIEHRFLDAVRALRRKKRDAAREVALAGGSSASSRHQSMFDRLLPDLTTASRVMRREDAFAAMLTCMAKLPDDYRHVIQRVYLDEATMAEVAKELEKTEDAVRRMAGRAVERLAACMGTASRYLSQG